MPRDAGMVGALPVCLACYTRRLSSDGRRSPVGSLVPLAPLANVRPLT